MNDVFSSYRAKLRTADEAVKAVKSGDWVDYTSNAVSYTHLTLPTNREV